MTTRQIIRFLRTKADRASTKSAKRRYRRWAREWEQMGIAHVPQQNPKPEAKSECPICARGGGAEDPHTEDCLRSAAQQKYLQRYAKNMARGTMVHESAVLLTLDEAAKFLDLKGSYKRKPAGEVLINGIRTKIFRFTTGGTADPNISRSRNGMSWHAIRKTLPYQEGGPRGPMARRAAAERSGV